MSDNPDTQPISVEELEKLLGIDKDVEEAKTRLPDSATFRAAVVGVLAFVAGAIGKPELAHTEWIDAIVSGYTVAAPVALGYWLRLHHKANS